MIYLVDARSILANSIDKIGAPKLQQIANGFDPDSSKRRPATDGQVQVNDLNGSDFFVGLSNRKRINTAAFTLRFFNDDLCSALGALSACTRHQELVDKTHAAGKREIESFAATWTRIENSVHDVAVGDDGS